MLANNPPTDRCGALEGTVHMPATFLHELITFIGEELPRWRDRPDRPTETSETALTSRLCAHLNSIARHAAGWDLLQFRVEEPDERQAGRKVDLVPAPAGTTLLIDGRRHTDFDPLLPIECKRLPTPARSDRDEREYVFSRHSSTGGIQRFKDGSHGAAHALGAMIGYVQDGALTHWVAAVGGWVRGLAATDAEWSEADVPVLEEENATLELGRLRSRHVRRHNLGTIELCHLWIKMN
jgi:hypothetical protein